MPLPASKPWTSSTFSVAQTAVTQAPGLLKSWTAAEPTAPGPSTDIWPTAPDDLGASRRGVRHLLLAHERASASEVQLRFALPSDCPVRRVLELTGVHRVLAVYPTLAEAVTGGLPPRSGGPGSQ